MSAPESERRLTPTERAHELLKLAMERPAPVSGLPWFEVSQTKATGGATVWEWDVHVPVCDEYPSAEQAFDALCSFAERLARKFPATVSNPPSEKSPEERTARAAAAIARNKAKA